MDYPISMKFGVLLQSPIPIIVKRSTSKPEVKFQYGCRLYSETRRTDDTVRYKMLDTMEVR